MAAGMPYVNYRWLGGMLTNFQTIQKRIYYMKELARMEETGEMNARPKKERLRLRRELSKLQQNLGGVAELTRVPDAIFIVDVNAETTAVKEAERLGLPVVALVDYELRSRRRHLRDPRQRRRHPGGRSGGVGHRPGVPGGSRALDQGWLGSPWRRGARAARTSSPRPRPGGTED
jgi:hypothetical protein